MGEHFGRKLTKGVATVIFYRSTDDLGYGTMRLYGECRNMTNHRNDNPAWTELADELRPVRGWCRESLIRRQCWDGLHGSLSERHATPGHHGASRNTSASGRMRFAIRCRAGKAVTMRRHPPIDRLLRETDTREAVEEQRQSGAPCGGQCSIHRPGATEYIAG